MEKCKHYKRLINSYIDNELTKRERLKLEKHMEKCEECLDEKNKLSRVIELCNDMDDEELPVAFGKELHRKLIMESSSVKQSGSLMTIPIKYVGILSAATAGILVILFLKGVFFNMFNTVKDNNIDANEQNIFKSAQNAHDIKEKDNKNTFAGSIRATENDDMVSDDAVSDIKGLGAELLQENVMTESIQEFTIIHPEPSEQIEKISDIVVENGGKLVDIWDKENKVVFRIENSKTEDISRAFLNKYGQSNVLLQEDNSNIAQKTKGLDGMSEYTYITVIIKKNK